MLSKSVGLGPVIAMLGTNVALTSGIGKLIYVALITRIFLNDAIQQLMIIHILMMAFNYNLFATIH